MGLWIAISTIFFLVAAALWDCRFHRIPNKLLLAGMLISGGLQLVSGWPGLSSWVMGFVLGMACLLPFYAFGGMSAGDVKLMAVVGGFVGVKVIWVAIYSLLAGGVIGLSIIVISGSLSDFLHRYWVVLSLRSYIPAAEDDVAHRRFPYAVAILCGTLTMFLLSFWN